MSFNDYLKIDLSYELEVRNNKLSILELALIKYSVRENGGYDCVATARSAGQLSECKRVAPVNPLIKNMNKFLGKLEDDFAV